ncbi:MAG: histidine kinase [Acidobacteria bacterium]|nr:histidine kinase [Acidobacteriota bacterium]
MSEHLELTSRYGMKTEEFSALMAYRVRRIMLVASSYDAFVLEEDGQLTELIFEEYRNLDLNLRFAPRFTLVQDAADAYQRLQEEAFDLVVTTPRLPDTDIRTFASRLRTDFPELPIGVLAAHAWDLPHLEALRTAGVVDWLFLWQGDVKALLAMIKQVEDRRNADHDVNEGGVQVIILVEDEVRFYSAYLPHIYTEVTSQTARLMVDGLNLSHRLLRIRARPKILLARTFDEAWDLFERYQGNVLGVIADVSFPRGEEEDPGAGMELARRIRTHDADVPVLLQSTDQSHAPEARAIPASFLYKGSPALLEEIRRYIVEHFGFGDFVFRLPGGDEVGRAGDMRELIRILHDAPAESLVYHAGRNHFSTWFKARTEFELAALLRPRQVDEFDSVDDLRRFLVDAITSYLREIQHHIITDFDGSRFDRFVAFAKIGSGSLGGKGRGLAFMHKLLARGQVAADGVGISIPQTVVLAADVFEVFLEENGLGNLLREADRLSDLEILDAFRKGRFGHERRAELASLLTVERGPLAVRSSSILEDSLYQPFAGVYVTVMLPNNHPSLDIRLAQLLEAIKVVYASTYQRAARDYLKSTPHRVEEERMAVLIQRLVGSRRGPHFYPTFSGVASSYNFYPFRDMKPEDGVALVALGLGKSVVEGFEALRFCPRYPQVLPQLSAVEDVLRNAQRRYYALDMSKDDVIPGPEPDSNLLHLPTSDAISNGAARLIASTYLPENDSISSGVVTGGTPLITFAPLLKGHHIPLPEILVRLLTLTERAMGVPVEIEFAVELESGLGAEQTLNVLQLRPMVVEPMSQEIEVGPEELERAVIHSEHALGHGRGGEISDLIVVDSARFERSRTVEATGAIEKMNARLVAEGRACILVGPGRWGSRDPWLGIPVAWGQIASARAIVETDFADLEVEPSQGSHFFHNLTCFGVAYLTVHEGRNDGRIDWEWLARQPAAAEAMDGVVRHIRLDKPLLLLVDGRTGQGVVHRSR